MQREAGDVSTVAPMSYRRVEWQNVGPNRAAATSVPSADAFSAAPAHRFVTPARDRCWNRSDRY